MLDCTLSNCKMTTYTFTIRKPQYRMGNPLSCLGIKIGVGTDGRIYLYIFLYAFTLWFQCKLLPIICSLYSPGAKIHDFSFNLSTMFKEIPTIFAYRGKYSGAIALLNFQDFQSTSVGIPTSYSVRVEQVRS